MLYLLILPIFLILYYVYNKDENKEPISLLVKLFGTGILSCFLVLLISYLLGFILPFMNMKIKDMDFMNLFLYTFFGVALVEEFCKWIMVYLVGYNNKEFDELYDILIYAVCVSLGFAFFENILYVALNDNSFLTALLRSVTAIPGHACDAIFMGYYLSIAKVSHYKKDFLNEKRYIILSIIIPASLHGIYDFCVMSDNLLLIILFFIFITVLYQKSLEKITEMSKTNRKLVLKNNFCPMCGNKIEGPFCGKCGLKQE